MKGEYLQCARQELEEWYTQLWRGREESASGLVACPHYQVFQADLVS